MPLFSIKKISIIIASAILVIFGGSFAVYMFSGTSSNPTETTKNTQTPAPDKGQIKKLFNETLPEAARESIEKYKKSLFSESNIDQSISTTTDQEGTLTEPPVKKTKTEDGQSANGLSDIAVTEEEIFAKLHEPAYLEGLAKLQNILIADGFIKSSDQSDLNSVTDIASFNLKMLDYMLQKGYINEFEHSQGSEYLNNGWPDLANVLAEIAKNNIIQEKSGKSSQVSSRFKTAINKYKSPHISITPIKELLDQFGISDFIKLAYKMVEPSQSNAFEAYWITTPNIATIPNTGCAKNISATVVDEPGPTLWAPCCNCGFFCAKGCKFFKDCGIYSASCNVPTGCLNLICQTWPQAAWDGWFNIPIENVGTGVCACG